MEIISIPVRDLEKTVARKKYLLEVPEKLKGCEVPEDIFSFIEDIYPNMLISIKVKVHGNQNIAEEIINNFVVYILSEDKRGKLRYLKYDKTKCDLTRYNELPYYKWFFSVLNYFYFAYQTELNWENRFISFLDSSEDGDNSEDGGVFVDKFCEENVEEEKILIFELEEYLKGKKEFLQLYEKKKAGYSNKEIALHFDMTQSMISQKLGCLRELMLNFFSETYFRF